MARLKRLEQSILDIPSDEQVQKMLRLASEAQRRAFALMAYAGLRPNEVRALRCRDVQLRREGEEAAGGFLSTREGRSYGETDTPKTGRREIPLAPALAGLLAPVAEGPREGYVPLTRGGEPWGDYGLVRSFERVRKRAGFSGWSVYTLRHYAITSWLRRGIPVHVVQKMAGHKNLSTTQRYVHFLKADLEDAARRLASGPASRAGPTHVSRLDDEVNANTRGSSSSSRRSRLVLPPSPRRRLRPCQDGSG